MRFILLLISSAMIAWSQTQDFSRDKIRIGKKEIVIEVARSDAEMARGLMYRKYIRPDQGMLFIYKDEQIRNFWMKNTFIPLSIGFFNKNRMLIDIQEMTPVTSEMQLNIPTYKSKKPAQFALEMPSGWFKQNNFHVDKNIKFEFLKK